MVGYGNNYSSIGVVCIGYYLKGSVNGYSIGLYVIWYVDDEIYNGVYLDIWV